MKLSAPIYVLKQKAKALKKSRGLALNVALDEVARSEGFGAWSLLVKKFGEFRAVTSGEVLGQMYGGDLLLLAGRPGKGKTSFSLEMLLQVAREKRQGYFFSLEYTHRDVASRMADLDESVGGNHEYLHFDFSDEISSDYIREKASDIPSGSVIVVDYLQLLDQRRSNPSLQIQVESLKEFAKEKKVMMVFISQVDRRFEMSERELPDLSDIRLPNPVDLKLFNKTHFL